MRNHEVTTKQQLLNEKGQIAEPGWSRRLLQEYRRGDIKAPNFRIKEWDYYLITNDQFGIAMTIGDLGYIGMQSVTLLDFTKPWEHTESVTNLFPMGKMHLPSTSEHGITEYMDERIALKAVVENNTRHLTCNFKKFNGDKDFKFDIILEQPEMDSLVIATPWEKKHHFYYNQKVNCMPATGWAEYDGRRYEFTPDKSIGTLDWGRGVWTYDNHWYWGTGNTYVNGKLFGVNLGYGFGDTSAASENLIIYDGKGHKLDDVSFEFAKDDLLKPWKITSSDSRFEMDFVPIIDRANFIDLKLVLSDQHQVFGKMTGTAILDDGTKLEIKDFLCAVEVVHNKY